MLKFKDSDGKIIGELSDEASEPEFYGELKDKKKLTKPEGNPIVEEDKKDK